MDAIEKVKQAISRINSDTSVAPEQTLEFLDEIADHIDAYRDALKEQLGP